MSHNILCLPLCTINVTVKWRIRPIFLLIRKYLLDFSYALNCFLFLFPSDIKFVATTEARSASPLLLWLDLVFAVKTIYWQMKSKFVDALWFGVDCKYFACEYQIVSSSVYSVVFKGVLSHRAHSSPALCSYLETGWLRKRQIVRFVT